MSNTVKMGTQLRLKATSPMTKRQQYEPHPPPKAGEVFVVVSADPEALLLESPHGRVYFAKPEHLDANFEVL